MSTVAFAVLMLGVSAVPEETVEQFDDCTYVYSGGEYENEAFHYRLLKPDKIEPDKKYPVILFLHGAGERGDDNVNQLMYFPEQMASSPWREKYPCFLIAPQCRTEKWWAGRRRSSDDGDAAAISEQMAVVEGILADVLEEQPIDRDRVYLTGLSMGGYGSWDLASRHPDWFAAVAPICGGGNAESAKNLVGVPLWAFHGGADAVVPVARSQEMIEAIRAAGGKPKYTEFEGVGHNSWTPAYSDAEGLVPWMFEQVNGREGAGSSGGRPAAR